MAYFALQHGTIVDPHAFVSSICLPSPALTLSTCCCIVLVVRFGIVLAFSIGGVPIGVLTTDPSAGVLRSVLGDFVWSISACWFISACWIFRLL